MQQGGKDRRYVVCPPKSQFRRLFEKFPLPKTCTLQTLRRFSCPALAVDYVTAFACPHPGPESAFAFFLYLAYTMIFHNACPVKSAQPQSFSF